jgi:hypothetical protein
VTQSSSSQQSGTQANTVQASEGQKTQSDQEINKDPSATAAPKRRGGGRGAQEDSSKNLSGDTTTPEPPEDDVPRGDPGDQVPDHGSIGLRQTGRGQEQAEVLQGLSDERRAQQLEAIDAQSARRSGADPAAEESSEG